MSKALLCQYVSPVDDLRGDLFQQLMGCFQESDVIGLDHSYARSWNSHPVSAHARPATLLFVGRDSVLCESGRSVNKGESVDVEGACEKIPLPQPSYDHAKCRAMIDECERHVRVQQKCIPDEIWDEERINRTGWAKIQINIFERMFKILDTERLSILSVNGNPAEYVQRRISVDKAARRVRQLFADMSWDQLLLQWLHATIIENLSVSYCTAYLEILQTLNSKIPSLIQRLFSRCAGGAFKQTIASDSLVALLKRPWDPVAPLLNLNRPRKLPGPPVFIVVPSGLTQNPHFPRVKFWYNHLAHLGKLITLPIPIVNEVAVSVTKQLEVTVNAVKAKVAEVKVAFPQRPIILIGWNSASLVACQTSLIESVSGVICMGCPLAGLSGPKDLDDPILDSRTPLLFVVGQYDKSCSIDDLEDFRGFMKCETGMIVVGGADNNLHVSTKHKRLLNVTQAMIDRCIVEEIYNFLNHVLSSIASSAPSSPVPAQNEKKLEAGRDTKGAKGKESLEPSASPVVPRKYRKRDRSMDDLDSLSYKRGPGRPKSKHLRHATSNTSPIMEPSQTVSHALATTAASTLFTSKTELGRPVKPITANILSRRTVRSSFEESALAHHPRPPTAHGGATNTISPGKNPISIGKLGSLSAVSHGSLTVVSPIKEEHRMVNPAEVFEGGIVDFKTPQPVEK